MRISDWSSDVFSSDLEAAAGLDHAVAQVAGLGVDALRAQYFAHVVGDLVARAQVDRGFEAALGDALFDAVAHAGVAHGAAQHRAAFRILGDLAVDQDRKSTRLNSSH